MNFTTFFSRQAREPAGWFGRWIMSTIFDFGNTRLNRFVYDIIAPQNGDRILEVGCGTGKLVDRIAGRVDGCVVEGIDFSAPMVSVARRKNKRHIAKSNVFIHQGNIDHMPAHTATFNKICSVNTIYFWTAPEATIKRMGRLLKPGGMLALGYEDIAQLKKRRLDTDVFRFYSHSDVETLLKNAGFSSDIRTRSIGFGPSVFHCTVAIK